jgi:hypothetical protein
MIVTWDRNADHHHSKYIMIWLQRRYCNVGNGGADSGGDAGGGGESGDGG